MPRSLLLFFLPNSERPGPSLSIWEFFRFSFFFSTLIFRPGDFICAIFFFYIHQILRVCPRGFRLYRSLHQQVFFVRTCVIRTAVVLNIIVVLYSSSRCCRGVPGWVRWVSAWRGTVGARIYVVDAVLHLQQWVLYVPGTCLRPFLYV